MTFPRLADGLLAGAAGVTALNLVTYLDMVGRARPASAVPEEVVEKLSNHVGVPIPGDDDDRSARLTALGALSGIATGTGVAVAVSLARAKGLRVPFVVEGVAAATLALASSDVPATALGVTKPGTWRSSDWISDVVPHLAYGVVVAAALRALRR